MVSVPENLTSTRKRVRRYFGDNKTKAEKFASKIRTRYHKGERGSLLTVEQSVQAAEALRILEGSGVSLIEAAQEAVRRRTEGGTETFREKWGRFVDEMEAHWRPRYAKDMGKIPRWVPSLMDRRVCDITPGMVREAVIAGGAKAESTIAARSIRINSVLTGRGKRRRAAKISILKPWARWRLLRACETPEERWAVALLLYAGIRPDAEEGEISRLDWEHFRKGEIYIPHEVSKTGSDRHIPITPRLAKLIEGHPDEGPVAPAWWYRKWRRIRKLARLGSEQDLTRHTFGSHFLAAFGEHEAKQAMGHTRDSDTIFRHYRRAVTTRAGRRYFRLLTTAPPKG